MNVRRKARNVAGIFLGPVLLSLNPPVMAQAGLPQPARGIQFSVAFPAAVHDGPITGRVFVCLSPTNEIEPRIAAYNSARRRDARVPFFATDVEHLQPEQSARVGDRAIGFPYIDIRSVPVGDYYVQAVLNVYTQFHRQDGHTIWAHMDQWEGQRWGFSPGNLVSEPQLVHIDPQHGATISLKLTRVLPPIEVPADTQWVKRVKIQSKILTAFWGHPMYLGATVLLPKGYANHPDIRYPVVYAQSHFTLDPPFEFTTEAGQSNDLFADLHKAAAGRKESGYDFYQSWNSDHFPRLIGVTFQHPTPYFDDSYAVNSANNGPYGDAILQELIPYLESHFRIIIAPYARVLTGGSTGGWESFALQVYHPDFFGGAWVFYPDPVDFRRYGLVNIYQDDSAFTVPNAPSTRPERIFQRETDGQPVATIRQISQMEYASGTRDRSGAQIDTWDAVYGPVDQDGYPKPLWNHMTGKIDHSVATYMRDHGYDLRYYLERNWNRVGPDLQGKLHLYCGDMDNFYLEQSVYLMEDFLKSTQDPPYDGEVVYGRPLKGHGWQPMTNAELVRSMVQQMSKAAPASDKPSSWDGTEY